jgi:hypothetical protein
VNFCIMLSFKQFQIQWLAIGAELPLVLTIVLLLTSCAGTTPLLPASPIDLITAKTIPVRESVVFGRVKLIVNEKPFVWDEPQWDNFRLYLLPDSGSEPIVYTLARDGSFYWHLLPGRYTITSFKWRRGANYLIRPIFASFSIPEQMASVYIGTLAISLTQTGPPGYSQATWKLPQASPLMHIEDDYEQALQGLRSNISGIKGGATKSLMRLEDTR